MSKTSYGGAAATSERELTEDDLALVSGGSISLPYRGPVFEYTPQKSGEGPETVTIWGIVMTVLPPK
jgi:hypothetical protein